jgi:hypothetical protein
VGTIYEDTWDHRGTLLVGGHSADAVLPDLATDKLAMKLCNG